MEDLIGDGGEFDGTWESLKDENMFETEAKSRYFMTNFKKYAWSKEIAKHIDGEIVVASWTTKSGDIPDNLSYTKNATILANENGGGAVMVKSVNCSTSGDEFPVIRYVQGALEEWGRALDCENGPEVVGSDDGTSQPAVVLTRGGAGDTQGDTHIIVEETSTHPSFLYSVWNVDGVTIGEGPVAVNYTFQIASTVRLAEAVVTGIVNGYTTGDGCFGLLRAYSRGPDTLEFPAFKDRKKANPFGENPEGGKVDSLQDVETIEAGMDVNVIAMICFVCLMVLSFIGISWSLLLRKRTGMDIYDRCGALFCSIKRDALLPSP